MYTFFEKRKGDVLPKTPIAVPTCTSYTLTSLLWPATTSADDTCTCRGTTCTVSYGQTILLLVVSSLPTKVNKVSSSPTSRNSKGSVTLLSVSVFPVTGPPVFVEPCKTMTSRYLMSTGISPVYGTDGCTSRDVPGVVTVVSWRSLLDVSFTRRRDYSLKDRKTLTLNTSLCLDLTCLTSLF